MRRCLPESGSIHHRISVSEPKSTIISSPNMRPEKASIVSDLSEKLKRSPFVLVTDYQHMKVGDFGELRNRLAPTRCGSARGEKQFSQTSHDGVWSA